MPDLWSYSRDSLSYYDDPYDLRGPTTPSTPRNSAGWTSYSKPSTALPFTAKVKVLPDDDSTPIVYTIPADGDGWWRLAAGLWPVERDTLLIPQQHCEFSHDAPRFNPCVYTATGDYLQARWGRKLDSTDRDWLAAHPLATDDGVPQEYTATCIDQLLQPYGMRVSKIRLRKGTTVLGDHLMGWLMALGCNPLAMTDRSTTNAQAAAAFQMTLEQADALWRVEFHDDPLPCSIIGERGLASTGSYSVGAFGGHARYLAPRGRASDWFISVQLAPDSEVSYLVPPPAPAYVPRLGERKLVYSFVTDAAGERIAKKEGSSWVALSALAKAAPEWTPPASSATTTTTAVARTDVPAPGHDPVGLGDDPSMVLADHECVDCQRPVQEADYYGNTLVCTECVAHTWSGLACPRCQVEFTPQLFPDFVTYGLDDSGQSIVYTWQCPVCKEGLEVDEDDPTADKYVLQVSELLLETLPRLDDPHDLHPTA